MHDRQHVYQASAQGFVGGFTLAQAFDLRQDFQLATLCGDHTHNASRT